MKWLVASALFVGMAAVTFGQGPGGPVLPEATVIAASDAWAQALQKNDVEAIDRLLTDDFITIQQTPDGVATISKPVQLDALKKTATTRPRLERQLSQTKVKMLADGNVAILTAVASYKGTDPNGAPLATQGVITEVWVRQGGTWRMTYFQPTNILRRTNAAPGR